jgi:hypothetical protein
LIDLAVSVFKTDHAHFTAARRDITDAMILRQIQMVCGVGGEEGEFDFGELPQIQQEMLIGWIVCHRLQIMNPLPCDPTANMAGRVMAVKSDTDSIESNAVAMKNPSDWAGTACGALFQKYLDSGAGILAFSKRCCQ